VYII